MLREIKNQHRAPLIYGFDITTPGTFNSGFGDIVAASVASGGTGLMSWTNRRLLSRFIQVGNAFQAIGNGACFDADPSSTGGTAVALRTNAGALADGRAHSLVMGWESSDSGITIPQNLNGFSGTSMRLIGCRVTGGTGVVAIGSPDFSCVRTGTGAYTVTFRKPFARPPIAVATAYSDNTVLNIVSVDATQILLTSWNASSVATNSSFTLMVYGSAQIDPTTQFPKPVFNTQRKPRVLAFQVRYNAGVPSAAIGAEDISGAITDFNTGNFFFTLARPFRREPIVVASVCRSGTGGTGTDGSWCQIGSNTTSSVLGFQVRNSAGTNVDRDVNILVLGYDDPAEY